jgi:hypothetical protein
MYHVYYTRRSIMLRQVIDLYEIMDDKNVTGQDVVDVFKNESGDFEYKINRVTTDKGSTDFIYIKMKGRNGKSIGKSAPTLGITGTLGGIGARPKLTGFVSDGDGALTVLAAGLKILRMNKKGDRLDSDVIITTHICPNAPVVDHFPVPFMGSSVDDEDINENCIYEDMDAIISVDTTKGNEIINNNGYAISNTVKEGYILSVSKYLLDIMKRTTGKMPVVFPLAQQDITPYGNRLSHLNSILQPSTVTKAPVLGIAITTELPIAGCATGSTHLFDIEQAARYIVEIAKEFPKNPNLFYDPKEYNIIKKLYGSQRRFQTKGVQIKKKVGLITMGQAARSDITENINDILEPELEVISIGALDGYNYDEVKEKFWPAKGEPFIVTIIGEDKIVKISENSAWKLVQKKIEELEERNIKASMLMCTGKFKDFNKKSMVLQPEKIIRATLDAIGVERIGILVPEEEQIRDSYKQYERYKPIIKSAEPYKDKKFISEKAKEFKSEDVDIILMDCMGYTEDMGNIVEKESGKNVLVPRVLATRLLKTLA